MPILGHRILHKALSLLIVLSVFSSLLAEEKELYRHIAAAGINKPVSYSEINNPSPIIAYSYFKNDLQNDLYGQFTLLTTNIYCIIGYKNEKNFAGIKPILNHTVYSAYHCYTNGVDDERRNFKGHNAGAELFYQYYIFKNISAKGIYYPGYYWYSKNTETKYPSYERKATEIDLPNKHWEHTGILEISFSDVKKKDIDRIKHGYFITGSYRYIYREGYGTFKDSIEAEDSSIKETYKRYLKGGVYYNFRHDINLLLDFSGAYHRNVDRNNSDQIGSFVSEEGVMPGYYWGEFYHNKYAIGRMKIGLPLFFWDARLEPGFNVLYMPKDNDVIGVGDYPRTIYRSISAGFSLKLGGILPFFADYAYGIDARRLNVNTGNSKRGHHEVMALFLMAFN